mmetsp:Transcript_30706/g.117487  ORF Transcript_30706/g.117487 Transcript_30706/m.117487 type:complete len:137 (-) Transcript_30706:1436-1846(-)
MRFMRLLSGDNVHGHRETFEGENPRDRSRCASSARRARAQRRKRGRRKNRRPFRLRTETVANVLAFTNRQVLNEVRPFLNVAGGTIELTSVTGVGGPQPMVRLKMSGTGSAINSVKMEITQRLRRNFPSIGQVIIK